MSNAAEAAAVTVPAPVISIETNGARSFIANGMAWLQVDDIKGSYIIPYIQASRDLKMTVECRDPSVTRIRVRLLRNAARLGKKEGAAPTVTASFPGLAPGEYAVEVRALDRQGRSRYETVFRRVGVGAVIGAMGDSITEGYYGRGFMQEDLALRAERFPSEVVSKDGRNFPQFAPTTHDHLPQVNCFESFMTRLNDQLSERWKQPVFIANEAWGGITSGGYLDRMRSDKAWQARVRALQPNIWLIHLGVNDDRAKVPPATFAANMESIVVLLTGTYGVKPAHIFIAKPCYDYFEGAAEILQSYCREIDGLVARRGLSHGPDLFAAYATDKTRWYSEDPVHPNLEGMDRMAGLWSAAVLAQLPDGLK